MPFKRIKGSRKFISPSGRVWTARQVRAYYATNGFNRGVNSGNPTRKKTRKDQS